MSRFIWIDSLKGILIILVVLGHCIQCLDSNFGQNHLFRYIYSFHMPLFMCVSGFLTYKKELKLDLIKKRFIQLIIPFFMWPLISVFTSGTSLWDKYLKLIQHPDTGLWFFWALFFITFFFYIGFLISQRIKCNLIFIIILEALFLNVILYITQYKIFGYQFISWYFIFFSLGYFLRKYNKIIIEANIKNKGLFMLLFISYIITAYFWMIKGNPTFYKWVNLGNLFIYAYKAFVAVLGIALFFLFSRRFLNTREKTFNSLLPFLGKKTLGIYAIHQLLLGVLVKNNPFPNIDLTYKVAITFLFTLFVSLCIVLLIEKNKYLSFLFLGRKK